MCPSDPTCGSPPSGPDCDHSAMKAAWTPGLLTRQVPPESTWWVCTSKMNSPGRLWSCASGNSSEQASSPIGPDASPNDLEGAPHAGVDPAEERVDTVASGRERPLDAVLHPVLVVRLAATELRLGRVEQDAVAKLHRLEVHGVVRVAVTAVGDRIVDRRRPAARVSARGERVPDVHRVVEVPEPNGRAALDLRDAGRADNTEVGLPVGESGRIDV